MFISICVYISFDFFILYKMKTFWYIFYFDIYFLFPRWPNSCSVTCYLTCICLWLPQLYSYSWCPVSYDCAWSVCLVWFQSSWVYWGLFCAPTPVLENIPCAFEKNVYSVILGWKVLWISIKSIWYNVSFKDNVFLLIFFLGWQPIDIRWILKSSTVIVLLTIASFRSFNNF